MTIKDHFFVTALIAIVVVIVLIIVRPNQVWAADSLINSN